MTQAHVFPAARGSQSDRLDLVTWDRFGTVYARRVDPYGRVWGLTGRWALSEWQPFGSGPLAESLAFEHAYSRGNRP